MLYLRFVRSPYAHAKIVSVDTSAAEKLPGVACALTGAEIVSQTQPFIEIGPDPFARIKDYPLAAVKVRYQGEPVAAVLAESPALADDAAELVQVEYEALDPVIDAEQALKTKAFSTKKPAPTGSGTASSNTVMSTRRSRTQPMS